MDEPLATPAPTEAPVTSQDILTEVKAELAHVEAFVESVATAIEDAAPVVEDAAPVVEAIVEAAAAVAEVTREAFHVIERRTFPSQSGGDMQVTTITGS